MKLIAYKIGNDILGIDRQEWNINELNGNLAFISIGDNDNVPNGYEDISSFDNWCNLGANAGVSDISIRKELLKYLPLSNPTANQISMLNQFNLNSYFLIKNFLDIDDGIILTGKPPINYDYDLLGLHKKRTLVKGELVLVQYYANYNDLTKVYSNLVVSEHRTYYRTNQLVSRREMTIKWYLNDGSVGYEKNTTKYYSNTESMQELDTRRSNIISDLKINTVGLVMICSGVTSVEAQTIARPMVSTYNLEISKYLQGYERELRDAITNDTIYSWLNLQIPNTGGLTIRMYLLDGLNVDYEINNVNT